MRRGNTALSWCSPVFAPRWMSFCSCAVSSSALLWLDPWRESPSLEDSSCSLRRRRVCLVRGTWHENWVGMMQLPWRRGHHCCSYQGLGEGMVTRRKVPDLQEKSGNIKCIFKKKNFVWVDIAWLTTRTDGHLKVRVAVNWLGLSAQSTATRDMLLPTLGAEIGLPPSQSVRV